MTERETRKARRSVQKPFGTQLARVGKRLACLLALWALAARGGSAASTLAGQVMFGTVPVPGATVVASQGDKRIVTSTDPQGAYQFADLADGTWTIQVEMIGFEPASHDATIAADTPAVNFTLTLLPFASVTGTVKPSAPSAVANAPRPPTPSTPAVASPSAANRTPPAGANRPAAAPAANAAPQPASPVTPGSAASGDNPGLNGDGLLVNGSVNNGAASPFAQLNAFGNNRRGGRSLYNWSLASFVGNSALDAAPFSPSGMSAPKPSYTDTTIQGFFGGPVKIPGLKNKAQITLSYQGVSDHNVTTQTALMPTLAERAGDLSGAVDSSGNPIQVINPATGAPFPGNQIPAGSISSQASALLGYYPLPNTTGAASFNFQAPILVTTRTNAFQSRVVEGINNKNQAFGNFNYSRTSTDTGNLFNFTDANRVTNIDAAANWSHRFSPFASLRIGYHFTASLVDTTPYFAGRENVSGLAGISGNDQTEQNWGPPTLAFTGGVAGLASAIYASNSDIANAFNAEGLWSHNRHNLTYGGALSERRLDVFSQQNPRGTITFSSGASSASGSDFADFLLGLPHASSIAYGNPDKYLTAPSYNAYVMDDWRINPTFTANVGIRWEFESPMSERDGRLVNLDVAPGFTSAAPVSGTDPIGTITGTHYSSALVKADWRGFQPRVAIAWRPIAGSSVVVRAGYGIYRNTQVYQPIASLMSQQPPLSISSSVSTSAANPLTLANPFVVPTVGVANTFAVDPNLRVGSAQNWQASLQRDLPASLTMNVTYLGTRGVDLMQEFLPNTYPIGGVNPCPTCPAGFVYLTSGGHSLRNAGQFQLRRRLRNGLTASVQYTLAKATDNATAFTGASMNGSAIAQNWLDLAAEEAPSNFDQRHQVAVQAQYSTGQGIGGGAMMTGVKGALLKGWTFTGQLTVGSGLPFTPVYPTTVPGTGVTGTIRASLTGTSTEADGNGLYLNPSGYTLPSVGEWGTAGRNSVRGPSQYSLNGGVGRSFLLGERLTLDWRFDATNLLNRVVYSAVNPIVTSPQFGFATQVNPMRKLQMVARLRF